MKRPRHGHRMGAAHEAAKKAGRKVDPSGYGRSLVEYLWPMYRKPRRWARFCRRARRMMKIKVVRRLCSGFRQD